VTKTIMTGTMIVTGTIMTGIKTIMTGTIRTTTIGTTTKLRNVIRRRDLFRASGYPGLGATGN
jgi:hypothetical protein